MTMCAEEMAARGGVVLVRVSVSKSKYGDSGFARMTTCGGAMMGRRGDDECGR
jgi:hypothetical protein